MNARKHPMAKRYQVKELAGNQVLFVVVSDLTDELLLRHLEHGMKSEDYEYCEAIAAECTLRNLPINKSIHNFLNSANGKSL